MQLWDYGTVNICEMYILNVDVLKYNLKEVFECFEGL